VPQHQEAISVADGTSSGDGAVTALPPKGMADRERMHELRLLLQSVASGGALPDVLTRVAEWIERISPGSLCSVLLLDESKTRMRHGAAPSLPAAYVQQIDGIVIGPRVGSCGTAAYTAKPVIVSDIANDPLWDDFRSIAAPFGLRACWSHPILGAAGQVLGTFAVYKSAPALPTESEWELLVDASHITALIIERSRADQARQEHERDLRSIVENAMDLIVRLDADARFTYVNPAALQLSGRTQEQLMGRAAVDLGLPESTVTMIEEVYHTAIRTRAPVRYEHALPTVQGERWLDAVTAPSYDAEGTLTGFVVIARDITEARQAREALRRSEERLRLIFDRSERSIALLDTDGRLKEVGDLAMQATALDRASVLNAHFWELPTFADSPQAQAQLRRAITDAAAGTPSGGEVTYRGAKGETRYGWFNAVPVRDAEGTVVELLLEGSDQTATRELELRVRQSEKMESLGRLAGGIAHDFNNVLAAILGYGELLLADAPPGTETFEGLQHIVTSSRRARDLVRQILAFSRKAEIAHQPVDLRLVMEDGLRLLRASLPSTIELRERVSATPLVVMGDATQLSQVLLNLGTNADYVLRKKGDGSLEVRLERVYLGEGEARVYGVTPGQYARLSVRDSGDGIPSAVLPKIFEPFFTTKPMGEGTGMGLAVVHGIVTSHGGGIRVESSSIGTAFEVVFPIVSTPVNVPVQPQASSARGSGRVLVVDDEAAIVNLLRRVLPRRGFEVVSLTTPVDALAQFQAEPDRFDLMITDRTMPRMTGEALAAQVHAIRPGLPVIITSGQGNPADEDEAMANTVFLAKPFDVADLMAAIERARRKVAR